MRPLASSLLAFAVVVAVDAALTSFDVRAMHRLARESIHTQLAVKDRRDATQPITSSASDSGQFLAMYSFADDGCSEDGAWTAFSVDTGFCITFDIKGHNVAYQLVCGKFCKAYSRPCSGPFQLVRVTNFMNGSSLNLQRATSSPSTTGRIVSKSCKGSADGREDILDETDGMVLIYMFCIVLVLPLHYICLNDAVIYRVFA